MLRSKGNSDKYLLSHGRATCGPHLHYQQCIEKKFMS